MATSVGKTLLEADRNTFESSLARATAVPESACRDVELATSKNGLFLLPPWSARNIWGANKSAATVSAANAFVLENGIFIADPFVFNPVFPGLAVVRMHERTMRCPVHCKSRTLHLSCQQTQAGFGQQENKELAVGT